MSCTGGWDWAPYSQTSQGGANTFSKGIWKSVYLATVGTAAITHVVPQIKYLGQYPNAPLVDGAHGGFQVDVGVHFWTAAACSGHLSVRGEWGGAHDVGEASIPAGDSKITLRMNATAAQARHARPKPATCPALRGCVAAWPRALLRLAT